MNKFKSIILGLILLSLFLYIYSERNKYHSEEKILLENHDIVFGKITDYGYSAGGAVGSAEYTYRINGKKYIKPFGKKYFCLKLSNEDKRIISTLNFPIIYSPENPEISRILLKSMDYRKYGVKMPEKISSTITKYFDCK